MKNRQGAFERYRGEEIELVGYTTCDGCPGGNVEYAPAEMKRNGADTIHFATGVLVGYPPCPYIDDLKRFIEEKYGLEVVLGTHPIPQGYFETHNALGTWSRSEWSPRLAATLADAAVRRLYD